MTEHYFVGVAPIKLFGVMGKTKIYREGDDKHLATINLAETGRSGTIKVIDDEAIDKWSRLPNGDNAMYQFESTGIFFGKWRILRFGQVIATATKPSIFSGRVRLTFGNETSWIYPGIFDGINAYGNGNNSNNKLFNTRFHQVLLSSYSRLWYNGLKYAFAIHRNDANAQVSHMFAVFNSLAFIYMYRRKRMYRIIYLKVLLQFSDYSWR